MLRRLFAPGVAALVAAALAGCRDGKTQPAEDTSYRARPGYLIDSVRPIEVDLAAFRDSLGPAPTELSGGASSFDGLMSRFARSIETRDTTALQRMQITAAEFAWLVYPSSPFTRPPYRQAPQIVWMQLRTGDTGLSRLLERRAGSPLRIIDHQCDPEPLREGDNKLWRGCTVRAIAAAGDTVRERLFGVVIERAGHFKFASYHNQY